MHAAYARPSSRPAPSPRADDLCLLTARQMLELFRTGAVSPVEVAKAVLERIGRLNPQINALYFVDPEGALAAARAAETRWRRCDPLGLLDGVPVTLKDSFLVRGMPTPNGTRAAGAHAVTDRDSPATARLREHGAVILGKTTMPDFGMIASGVSSMHGVTRNPWNLERNPGGSSSGAGAAVAAGLGPLAVGSDIGGSVRIPAAFCGIAGLKPSYGRVPLAFPWPALVGGPLARDVGDIALLLQVISEPDAADYTALPWEETDYLDAIDAGVRGLRLGLLPDIGFGLPVETAVRERVEGAAALLGELGAVVEPMAPIFDHDPEPDFDRMVQAYAWQDFAALSPGEQASVMPEIAAWCRKGAAMSAAELTRVMASIGETRRRVLAACARFDYVLSPTMAMEPYRAELPWPPGGTQHNAYCFPFNLSEQPALSVCCGLTVGGLPVGLQIVGRRFDDAGVLRVGHAYEQARGPLPGRPLA